MKSLDERISSIVSPFDEGDLEQDELITQQHLQYQKDAILESIGTRKAKIEWDLHMEEIIEQIPKGIDYSSFLGECLKKLTEEYNLDVLYDYIQRRGILDNSPDQILNLLKYFVYDQWVEHISNFLPKIDIKKLDDNLLINNLLTESFLEIQNKIIKSEDINPLVRFYFQYCPEEEGQRTLLKLIMSDLLGVISFQLIKEIK